MASNRGKKRRTLLEELADLSTAAPSDAIDPENGDYGDGTAASDPGGGASGVLFGADGANGDEDERMPTLRVAAAMEDDHLDEIYAGKRVSRKHLYNGDMDDAANGASDGEGSSSSREDGEDENAEEEEEEEKEEEGRPALEGLSLGDISSDEESEEEDGGGRGGGTGYDDAFSEDDADGFGGGQTSVFAGLRGASADAIGVAVDAEIARLEREDAAHGSRHAASSGSEMRKAREVLRQKQWYDGFLELRILLQRLLNATNRLPTPDALPAFRTAVPAVGVACDAAAAGLVAAAADLVDLRAALAERTGASGVVGVKRRLSGDAADSSGSSGAGVRGSAASSGDNGGTLSLEEVEARAAEGYLACKQWWVPTVDRWQAKTQLHSAALQKKFRVINQGVWTQVSAVLADKERARRKLYMRAAAVDRFGASLRPTNAGGAVAAAGAAAAAAGAAATAGGTDSRKANGGGLYDDEDGDSVKAEAVRREAASASEVVDTEVFDDGDFYQFLLKEFISAGSAGDAAGAAAGVPRAKRTKKGGVDTRASKGRKVRYAVHPKLENFMFPVEYPPPPMDAGELFNSLFGSHRSAGGGNDDSRGNGGAAAASSALASR